MPSEIELFEEALAALFAAQGPYVVFATQHYVDPVMKRNIEHNCARLQTLLDDLRGLLATVN